MPAAATAISAAAATMAKLRQAPYHHEWQPSKNVCRLLFALLLSVVAVAVAAVICCWCRVASIPLSLVFLFIVGFVVSISCFLVLVACYLYAY